MEDLDAQPWPKLTVGTKIIDTAKQPNAVEYAVYEIQELDGEIVYILPQDYVERTEAGDDVLKEKNMGLNCAALGYFFAKDTLPGSPLLKRNMTWSSESF